MSRRLTLGELSADTTRGPRASSPDSAERRLLTLSDGTVEVAHEALLDEWPRLRTWLQQDAGAAACSGASSAPPPTGMQAGMPFGDLYRGATLAAALEWGDTHAHELNAPRARRSWTRAVPRARAPSDDCPWGWRSWRPARPAVLAGVVALDAAGQRTRARRASPDAQRLGAAALVDEDLDRSLLLAREGLALEDTLATRGNLFAALLGTRRRWVSTRASTT